MSCSHFRCVLAVVTLACPLQIAFLAPPVAAQKPELAPGMKRAEFELRIVRVGNTFQSIRFNVRTGESWLMERDKYERIPDPDPLAAGEYEVSLITDDNNWMAFRIDRVTGTTWQLRANKWSKVKEPADKEK